MLEWEGRSHGERMASPTRRQNRSPARRRQPAASPSRPKSPARRVDDGSIIGDVSRHQLRDGASYAVRKPEAGPVVDAEDLMRQISTWVRGISQRRPCLLVTYLLLIAASSVCVAHQNGFGITSALDEPLHYFAGVFEAAPAHTRTAIVTCIGYA